MAKKKPVKWEPFKEAYYPDDFPLDDDKVYKNNQYQVAAKLYPSQGGFPQYVGLSIKKLNKHPVHDWRDLQRIKNELCGINCQAIEIYPPESELVDTANQYHLWVFPPGICLPIGFSERRVSCDPEFQEQLEQDCAGIGIDPKQLNKSKQREFKEHHKCRTLPEIGRVWQDVGYEGVEDD